MFPPPSALILDNDEAHSIAVSLNSVQKFLTKHQKLFKMKGNLSFREMHSVVCKLYRFREMFVIVLT